MAILMYIIVALTAGLVRRAGGALGRLTEPAVAAIMVEEQPLRRAS
jgi:hypothetical protein